MKKFNEFDPEIQEVIEDFNDTYGYEMGKDFIFAMINDEEDQPMLAIQPKSYWDNENCQYDQHITKDNGGVLDLPYDFEEIAESTLVYQGDLITCINTLVQLGIRYNVDFQSFMEEHTGVYYINGISLSAYMQANHPNSII